MFKKIKFKSLKFIPSSHENQLNPAVVKKIIFEKEDIPRNIRIQMINWAKLFKKRSFTAHYHEDMDEIFIILSGKVRITIDDKTDFIQSYDVVYIPMGSKHKMENISSADVNYIAIGLSRNKGGKTVIVE